MCYAYYLYNVHAESVEMEKWSIPSTKIDYVDHERNGLTNK